MKTEIERPGVTGAARAVPGLYGEQRGRPGRAQTAGEMDGGVAGAEKLGQEDVSRGRNRPWAEHC